jgi:hypothetical protein
MSRRPETHRRWATALRWILRSVIVVGIILGLLALPLVLTTRVIPPAAPQNPVTVIIVDHGDTASLVLPSEDGTMIRFAYGDWQWYAMGTTSYFRAIPTLAFPTQGALGRQEMPGPISEQAIAEQMKVGFEQLHPLSIEQDQGTRLRAMLDKSFQQNLESRVFNRGSDMYFVHHRRRYTYFYNSNHMVADWLMELGCQVRGPAYGSRWRVESHAVEKQ